jgi:hypothetical protein
MFALQLSRSGDHSQYVFRDSRSASGEPAATPRGSRRIRSGSGELAAPRRQSLLRSQARCALLPAATPRVRAEPPLCGRPLLERVSRPPRTRHDTVRDPFDPAQHGRCLADICLYGPPFLSCQRSARAEQECRPFKPCEAPFKRGVAAGRSAQRACERSSDWRRGAASSPHPEREWPKTDRRCSPDPEREWPKTDRRCSPDPERKWRTFLGWEAGSPDPEALYLTSQFRTRRSRLRCHPADE